MMTSENSLMPVSEHFSELYKIIRTSALIVILFSILLSFFIDDLIKYWLGNLGLDYQLITLSVYSPYDWINIKWAILLIFSISIVVPITSLQLRNFALPGLYPRERKWVSIVLLTCSFVVPFSIFLLWIFVLPSGIIFLNEVGIIEGVVARYDAVSIISIGIGISWILVIGISIFIILSLSRIFGIVEDNESRVRIRILLIGFSLIFLTLPETYEGLRILIAFFTIILADSISRMTPIYE
jgi:Sec-independent protein secretion pathway component TatC